jgi:hypothetical protein
MKLKTINGALIITLGATLVALLIMLKNDNRYETEARQKAQLMSDLVNQSEDMERNYLSKNYVYDNYTSNNRVEEYKEDAAENICNDILNSVPWNTRFWLDRELVISTDPECAELARHKAKIAGQKPDFSVCQTKTNLYITQRGARLLSDKKPSVNTIVCPEFLPKTKSGEYKCLSAFMTSLNANNRKRADYESEQMAECKFRIRKLMDYAKPGQRIIKGIQNFR